MAQNLKKNIYEQVSRQWVIIWMLCTKQKLRNHFQLLWEDRRSRLIHISAFSLIEKNSQLCLEPQDTKPDLV